DRHRLLRSMYTGPFLITAALVEANALRSGDSGASARKVEQLADRIDRAPPLVAGASWRARAYAADARGRREDALRFLERSEIEAAKHERKLDVATARYQRGLRIGGDEGRALIDGARASVRAAGIAERLLEEDAGLR